MKKNKDLERLKKRLMKNPKFRTAYKKETPCKDCENAPSGFQHLHIVPNKETNYLPNTNQEK